MAPEPAEEPGRPVELVLYINPISATSAKARRNLEAVLQPLDPSTYRLVVRNPKTPPQPVPPDQGPKPPVKEPPGSPGQPPEGDPRPEGDPIPKVPPRLVRMSPSLP